MTLDEALSQAHGSLKAFIAMAIGNYRKSAKERGLSDAKIEAAVAAYSEEMNLWKEEKMAEMRAELEGWIARDGQSLH